jgi:hypothetical protein
MAVKAGWHILGTHVERCNRAESPGRAFLPPWRADRVDWLIPKPRSAFGSVFFRSR